MNVSGSYSKSSVWVSMSKLLVREESVKFWKVMLRLVHVLLADNNTGRGLHSAECILGLTFSSMGCT